MIDIVEVECAGRGVKCRVIWTSPSHAYIVAQHPDGREIIAKRRLGAWMEMAMTDVVARLERLDTETLS